MIQHLVCQNNTEFSESIEKELQMKSYKDEPIKDPSIFVNKCLKRIRDGWFISSADFIEPKSRDEPTKASNGQSWLVSGGAGSFMAQAATSKVGDAFATAPIVGVERE